MAFVSCICPKCGQPTLLNADGLCLNTFKSGVTCGFSIPIKFIGGNSKYREKFVKHTNPPKPGSTDTLSWVAHSGDYSFHQEFTIASGSLHLDKANNYLFLWSTPQDATPIARIFYGNGGSVGAASGTIMPLNSKIQNLHHFYGNYDVQYEHIADGPDLVIEAPTTTHGDYRVFDKPGGTLLYAYDPVAKTSQKLSHDVPRLT